MSESELGEGSTSGTSSISMLSERLNNLKFDWNQHIPQHHELTFRGTKVDRFKPAAFTGLYADLIKHNKDIKNVVRRLILAIQANFNDVHQILQLIPDVMLIDYTIGHYSSQNYEVQIGTELEIAARRLDHILECDIVFTHESTYAKELSKILDVFIWYLCKQLTANVSSLHLFEKIMRVFISFLRHIGGSDVDALRLTAYIFALRIMKCLSLRKCQIAKIDALIDVDAAIRIFHTINDVLITYKVDDIYCGRQNNQHFVAYYLDFAKCCHVCIVSHDSNIFCNEKNLNLLGELLALMRTDIVKAAMESCTVLLKQPQISDIFETESFETILQSMYMRLNHTNDEIAMIAATFFTVAFQYRHRFPMISENVVTRLIYRSYNKNLKLAKMCGQALAMVLKQSDVVPLYKHLINICDKFDMDTYKRLRHIKYAFLVEALYHYMVQLEPTCILIALIKCTGFTDMEFKALMEICYASCCMYYKGRVFVERDRGEKPQDHFQSTIYKTTKCMLEAVPKLIENSSNDYDTMVWIYRMLSLINYALLEVVQVKRDVQAAVEKSLKFFDIDKISEHFWLAIVGFIYEASFIQGGKHFLDLVDIVLMKTVEEYNRSVTIFRNNKDGPKELLLDLKYAIIIAAKKISSILTIDISVKNVDLAIFQIYWPDSDLPLKIITEQIKICALHFKCRIRDFLNPDNALAKTEREVFANQIYLDLRSFWMAMDRLLEGNDQYFGSILEAMGVTIANYNLLFSANTEHPLQQKYEYWTNWNTADTIFNSFFEGCIQTTNMVSVNMSRKYFKFIITLYYQPEQPNALTPYIRKLVAYYEKCCALYEMEYKEFFCAIIEHSKTDFYNVVVSALEYINDNINSVETFVNDDSFCKSIAEFIPNHDMEDFLKHCVDFVDQKSTHSLLKYVRKFSPGLSRVAKEQLNEHASRILPEGTTLF